MKSEQHEIDEFLAEAAELGSHDSSGAFTTTGREVVEKIGRCLLADSTAWILLLVQVANLWEAERIEFSFEQGFRVEMKGVGDRRDWLKEFVPQLLSGQLSGDLSSSVLQKAIWSALAQSEGTAVLVASDKTGETRAVRLGLSESQWGSAGIAAGSFVFTLNPGRAEFLTELRAGLKQRLERYSCSDRTVVVCGHSISAFLPISPRSERDDSKESGLGVGLWAQAAEGHGVPLGRSFARIDAEGWQRKELTFGTFRVRLKQKAPNATEVWAFTHHSQPTPSRVVWLWKGTEVCHQEFEWVSGKFAATLYIEAPHDVVWDLSQQTFRWSPEMDEQRERALASLKPAMEELASEFNAYSPRVEGGTLGCWFLLLLFFLAGAGLAAPMVGSGPAFAFGSVLALLAIRSEFRFRHRTRYSLGESLKEFASRLDSDTQPECKSEKLWVHQL